MDSLVRPSIHGLPDVPGQDCPFEKNKRIDLGTAHGASLKIWPAAALVAGDENTTDYLRRPQRAPSTRRCSIDFPRRP